MECSSQLSLAANGEPGNRKFTKYTHARTYAHALRKKTAQTVAGDLLLVLYTHDYM